jgi:hypothetical protein
VLLNDDTIDEIAKQFIHMGDGMIPHCFAFSLTLALRGVVTTLK